MDQYNKLGLDRKQATELAYKLHAHSVQYAHKLAIIRRAVKSKVTFHSQVIELGAFSVYVFSWIDLYPWCLAILARSAAASAPNSLNAIDAFSSCMDKKEKKTVLNKNLT
eukprot:1159505-Pelagomonas_calceolata.AAC.6